MSREISKSDEVKKIMDGEYSLAYTYQSDDDIQVFKSDFIPFLHGLLDDIKYRYSIKNLSDEFLKDMGSSDCIERSSLPERYKKPLKEIIESPRIIEDMIFFMFGGKYIPKQMQVSYGQAFALLVGHTKEYEARLGIETKQNISPINFKKFNTSLLKKSH